MIAARPAQRALVGIALLVILLAASLLRFSGLDREGRWCDEYWQTRAYDLPLTYPHYVVMAAREHGQPPLDYLLGWLVAKVARSDWVRRAPAAIFGVAGVALCFLFVRRITSPAEGLIAAALLAVSPLHWSLSQEARPYTICIAFLLLAMWAMARALQNPTRGRLLAYAGASYLMVLTRGMLPYVVLLGVGVTLTVALLFVRLRSPAPEEENYRALRRVWLVTMLVGLAAVPILVFLMYDNGFITFTSAGRRNGDLFGAPFLNRLESNAAIWAGLPAAMFGPGGAAILVLAAAGAMLCVLRRHALSLPGRYTLATLAIVPVLYLLTYSGAVSFHPINYRYGLFVVPIVAIFAAIATAAALRSFWRSTRPGPTVCWAVTIAIVFLMVAPAATTTVTRTTRYYHPDWRSLAAHLVDKVTPQDVIIVFQDRPLGRPQMTFWGKYDWPREMEKPLAEPAWTLASSEAHWRRLVAQTGRPLVVIRQEFQPGPKDDYVRYGLAEAPPGMTLSKFRGLDLLTRSSQDGANTTAQLIEACNALIALPKQHPDSNVMLYVLRSRLELLSGELATAAESFEQARRATPPKLAEWFDDAVAAYAATLAEALARAATTQPKELPTPHRG